MERQYSHLTWKNRLKIRRMLDERRKPKEIADALHVHTSTIYREIKRGQTWQMTSEWEYVQKYRLISSAARTRNLSSRRRM